MGAIVERNPILNNPYLEPKLHYRWVDEHIDYEQVLQGRRPVEFSAMPNSLGSRKNREDVQRDLDLHLGQPKFVEAFREAVGAWRNEGYPGVTRVTGALLEWWFLRQEADHTHRLFFCQQEAVETAIWLNEVAPQDPNLGRRLLGWLAERQRSVSRKPEEVLPRVAFKMATGTGKTVVMAMLILYNYLNRQANGHDKRFADYFLVVAPGITIKDRLGVLRLDSQDRPEQAGDYYHQRFLIPKEYEGQVQGLNRRVFIVNYQQLLPRQLTGNKQGACDGKTRYDAQGQPYTQEGKESYGVVWRRVLQGTGKGKRLLVINDEAHHCYLPRPASTRQRGLFDDVEADKEENARAMVWYEGLRQLPECGYRLQHVYDLSATPYYLHGSGHLSYQVFPWVVSDFGFVEAVESGLVKIPFLPKGDSSQEVQEAKWLNLYEEAMKEGGLPPSGKKASDKRAKEAKKQGKVPPLESFDLGELVKSSLRMLQDDYVVYAEKMGIDLSQETTTQLPPVFIAVCNNTNTSRLVYQHLAGYQDANGVCHPGTFACFSNYREGASGSYELKRHPPTLLIDNIALDAASQVVDEEFKKVFKEQIADFVASWQRQNGAASTPSDSDILRELVNTVGKPGKLGQHIRCVVSVSMLTEGWDANTVSHVYGLRPFHSQLLCEQVAGRALRRRSYSLCPHDAQGNQIDESTVAPGDSEVTWKFPPEYARVVGIPFSTMRGRPGATVPPDPPEKVTLVRARPERELPEDRRHFRFPNVVGYRKDLPSGRLRANWAKIPKYVLDFTATPSKVYLRSYSSADTVEVTYDFSALRDQQVVYELAQEVMRRCYCDTSGQPELGRFAELLPIVRSWYEEQLQVLGDLHPQARRAVISWPRDQVVEAIHQGIVTESAKDAKPYVRVLLNPANPESSTAFTRFTTTRPVFETTKSPITHVVADTGQWEQIAAKSFEEMPEVLSYFKNDPHVGLAIPYLVNGRNRQYFPDFVLRVRGRKGEECNLIVEVSGYSDDDLGHKDIKRYTAEECWVPGVNQLGSYGRWAYLEVSDIKSIKSIVAGAIREL